MKKLFLPALTCCFIGWTSVAAAKDRAVTVTGECSRKVVPDRASLTLVAEFTDLNAGSASQRAINQYNEIRDRVKKMNLKNLELETSEFSVNEEIEWNGGKKKSRGFKARMGLKVATSETSRLGEVANLASDLKVRDVSGLQSFVSQSTLRTERENCLEEAAKNARSKAEKLAQALNAKLGSVISIREDGASSDVPIQPMARGGMLEMQADVASKARVPTIESGSTEVSAGIEAVFDLQ